MTVQTPIRRRALSQELVERLRDMIVSGRFAPGDKISEPELCTTFGVSRTPLREALKVLASDGLVMLTPNRGASIATIDPSEVVDLFPIMGALEGLAGELAAARATRLQVAELHEMHVNMFAYFDGRNWVSYSRANRAIHQKFFDIAGNPALSALYANLMVRIRAVRFVARKSEARWIEAVDDHHAMMAALRAGDSQKLGQIMRDHLRHKADSVLESLAELERAPGP